MTASELTRHYLDDSGHQICKAFEGLPEELADVKLAESAMSARETLVHLTDCLFAAQKAVAGEGEYAWGSYKPSASSMAALMDTFNIERAKVVDAIAARGDDVQAMKAAQAYLAGHEYYHVGQMAALRLKVTPDWDAYSIYR